MASFDYKFVNIDEKLSPFKGVFPPARLKNGQRTMNGCLRAAHCCKVSRELFLPRLNYSCKAKITILIWLF